MWSVQLSPDCVPCSLRKPSPPNAEKRLKISSVKPRGKLVSSSNEIKVTLIRSLSGRIKAHQDCVRGLGLRRIHQTISVKDTPENRGMINKAYYLLKVEEA
ncbi:MAG: 50S ribosomal protein L30 [Gammaproteobacteria bacterium]|nr:50S ribosomal protein L30 [Gammaproteobacteria bacterium]